MLTWKNLESDLVIADISAFIDQYNWLEALLFLYDSFEESVVYVTQKYHEQITAHLSSDCRNELGGLLLGDIFKYPYNVKHNYPFLSIITDSTPSFDFRNTSVSLQMGTELWNRAQEFINKGRVVLGWYHSHSSLGAFFSHTDRATQKAFFSNSYSIGVVIDPVRFELKNFIGPEAEELENE